MPKTALLEPHSMRLPEDTKNNTNTQMGVNELSLNSKLKGRNYDRANQPRV